MKQVPGERYYFVSGKGEIWSNALFNRRGNQPPCYTKKKLKLTLNARGQQVVGIGDNIRLVAEVVCSAWHGSRPSSAFTVGFLDGNSTNLKPSNLRWIDRTADVSRLFKLGYSAHDVRAIPGYPGYFATNDGNIVSLKQREPLILKPSQSWYGYKRVYLSGRNVYVHRAVCLAWHGLPPPGDTVVRHLNGDKLDNQPSNLAWGSKAQNELDKCATGSVKLNPQLASDIRALIANGASHRDVAKRFDVSRALVGMVANHRIWKQSPEFQQFLSEHRAPF